MTAASFALCIAVATGTGCSDDEHRDSYYGTDAGSDFRLPDATAVDGDGGANDSGQDGGATETSADAGADARPDVGPEAMLDLRNDSTVDVAVDRPVDVPTSGTPDAALLADTLDGPGDADAAPGLDVADDVSPG